MRLFLSFSLLVFTLTSLAQDSTSVAVDEKYREDQFYASITYNLLANNPDNINSSGFSTGYHLGFIRDFPVNEKRNFAVGLGFGISSNSYNSDLVITESGGNTTFQEQNSSLGNVTKNKFTTYMLEVPFELRWRTSTPTQYKFWRIYPGFKLSYLVYNTTKLKSDTFDQNLSNLDSLNRLQYGLTLSAGYGTWNFHVYYGLNPIFENSAQLNGASIGSQAFKLGLIFYIL